MTQKAQQGPRLGGIKSRASIDSTALQKWTPDAMKVRRSELLADLHELTLATAATTQALSVIADEFQRRADEFQLLANNEGSVNA